MCAIIQKFRTRNCGTARPLVLLALLPPLCCSCFSAVVSTALELTALALTTRPPPSRLAPRRHSSPAFPAQYTHDTRPLASRRRARDTRHARDVLLPHVAPRMDAGVLLHVIIVLMTCTATTASGNQWRPRARMCIWVSIRFEEEMDR